MSLRNQETTNVCTLTSLFPAPADLSHSPEKTMFLSEWSTQTQLLLLHRIPRTSFVSASSPCLSSKVLYFWKATEGWQLFSLLSSLRHCTQKTTAALIGAMQEWAEESQVSGGKDTGSYQNIILLHLLNIDFVSLT